MEWKCLICEQSVEICGDPGSLNPATWPNVVGGTITIDFGYPSRFDQMNGLLGRNHTKAQTCICDDCFEKKKHLTRTVIQSNITKWEIPMESNNENCS